LGFGSKRPKASLPSGVALALVILPRANSTPYTMLNGSTGPVVAGRAAVGAATVALVGSTATMPAAHAATSTRLLWIRI
jgi:hypothetical protein